MEWLCRLFHVREEEEAATLFAQWQQMVSSLPGTTPASLLFWVAVSAVFSVIWFTSAFVLDSQLSRHLDNHTEYPQISALLRVVMIK